MLNPNEHMMQADGDISGSGESMFCPNGDIPAYSEDSSALRDGIFIDDEDMSIPGGRMPAPDESMSGLDEELSGSNEYMSGTHEDMSDLNEHMSDSHEEISGSNECEIIVNSDFYNLGNGMSFWFY
jgi:hypothetical protein